MKPQAYLFNLFMARLWMKQATNPTRAKRKIVNRLQGTKGRGGFRAKIMLCVLPKGKQIRFCPGVLERALGCIKALKYSVAYGLGGYSVFLGRARQLIYAQTPPVYK